MSAILYRNDEQTVIVIDVPASIKDAQGVQNDRRVLLSSAAPSQPWPDCEPKSAKARAKFVGQTSQADLDICEAVGNALKLVHQDYHGSYCLHRQLSGAAPGCGKRGRDNVDAGTSDGGSTMEEGAQLVSWSSSPSGLGTLDLSESTSVAGTVTQVGAAELSHRLVRNTSLFETRLRVITGGGKPVFTIPPGASFFLADVADPAGFQRSIGSRQFYVIVVDPPWPNRSVRRGATMGNAQYHVASSMSCLRELLDVLDMASLLAEGGYAAVWITNNTHARQLLVSDRDGLFAANGLQVIEEWVWLKVTSAGEPVLPVDGVWRKPYEVLLVARKLKGRSGSNSVSRTSGDVVKRRVVTGVPDLHSRKPCLKAMFQDVFGLAEDYRGLEVFARHLTSGWCSWGNEVLKFNNERCWSGDVEGEHVPKPVFGPAEDGMQQE